ncbi:Appr-1-p processing protein [Streptomyces sp. NPDC008001]|uniref:Appr-1-p processing protein n=1 Tax=Streptomyces sp. NPDC008001 TaxID=3364804 RepID=UPI0036E8EE03
MSTEIEYRSGDATLPQASGPRIIAHVCNDAGGWGAGFVVAVSRRWRQPEAAYRAWHRDRATSGFALGALQLVRVEDELWVANMVGQHGIRKRNRTSKASGDAPVRYEAIDRALASLADEAVALRASVHMPRIGCGLAGGRWDVVEPLVTRNLTGRGVAVTVYDPV